MGNSVFCSISTEDNNDQIFDLIKGENGNNFDLEKSILPIPAQLANLVPQGYRDVLAMAHIDNTFKHEDKRAAFAQVLKLSRLQYDFLSAPNEEAVEDLVDKLLTIYIDSIYLCYDENGNLRENHLESEGIKPSYADEGFVYPATFAEIEAQAAEVYKTCVEVGEIYVSGWRYSKFGCSWLPRFGESEEGYIKFETITSAPVEGFKLFAKATKLNGSAEYFEENHESFWGVLEFKDGELVAHRENDQKDKADFYG